MTVGLWPPFPSRSRREYIDASILITDLKILPFIHQKTVEEVSQVFQVVIQPQGRRVMQRLSIELRVAGAEMIHYGYLFGYNVHRVSPPILLREGEVIEVLATMNQSERWWTRLVDRVWDWFKPPKARVLLMGVFRKGEN